MDVPNWLLQQLIQLGDDDVDSDPDDPDEHQDGEATQAELQRLAAADWTDLKPAYAAACARACVVARELPVSLPPELIAAIAGNSAEAPVERFCTCGQRGREELTMTPLSYPTKYRNLTERLVVCAACGKPTLAAFAPRVLPAGKGGDWHALRLVNLEAPGRAVHFKPCRHFHRQRRESQGDGYVLAKDSAMRHRASGLHSFRTIVANEWVHRGRAEYFVGLESLREPFAFGIGVVRPDSNVNSALGWTPGVVCAPPRTGWGVCWEGRPEGSPGNERRSSPHSSWRSDRYRESDPKLPVGVRQGDGVSLVVDMTAGFIEVHVLRFVPESGTVVPESVARIDLDRTAQEAPAPVALAIALKYAGDCVSVYTDEHTDTLYGPYALTN